MNKDNHLIFEKYFSKFFKSEPFNSEDSEDCEDRAGEVNWHDKVQRNDHVEHGRRAAKWELESGKKAHNPHQPGSDEAKEWEFGYKEEKGIHNDAEDAEETDDERYDREASELEAVMKQHKPNFKDTSFWDAYKAVKGGLWSEDEFHQWAQSVWADGSNDAHYEGEEVTEAKHSKKHIFAKVEKAAEKAGYSKKSAEKIAGAAKAKASKKK